jgi:hypothetical protein
LRLVAAFAAILEPVGGSAYAETLCEIFVKISLKKQGLTVLFFARFAHKILE